MRKLIWLITGSLFLISCNSKSDHQTSDTAIIMQDSSSDLTLNNGQQWFVNEEMKPFIEAGEQLIDTYLQSDTQDYQSLAAQLKEQNDRLIKSCTMTGESHEALHQWLHPHLVLVSDLAKADNRQQADTLVQQLKQSFGTFHKYFR